MYTIFAYFPEIAFTQPGVPGLLLSLFFML